MKKKVILFLSLILLTIPTALAIDVGDFADFFSTGGALANVVANNPEFSSFILLFALFLAIYMIGMEGAKKALKWQSETAPKVIAVILAISSTILTWSVTDRGRDIMENEQLGKLLLLLPIVIVLIYVGYIFYKKKSKEKETYFLILAIIILIIYYILEAVLGDNFTDEGLLGGGLGSIIDIVFFIAWLVFAIGGAIVLWNKLIAPLFGLKAKKPLSDTDYADTVKAIKQKRGLGEQEAVSKAKKKERKVRRGLKRISRKIKKAAEVLGNLHQVVAQQKPNLIKGKWRKWSGELKKLEKIKVKVSAYAALVSKVLDETADLPISKPLKDKLEIYQKSLLKDTNDLEQHVSDITDNISQIDNTTPANDVLWADTITAIKNASNAFSKILRDGEAGLALEQRVREDLGRE